MNHLKIYLLKVWFVMKLIKIKMEIGYILMKLKKLMPKTFIKKSDKTKVIVGPPESMSKSKKNTIDPETMIKNMVQMQ